ncbi:MAG: 2-oxo acid dehydrogenase subunit E2 [Acidimicrobiia bacterium]
MKELYVPALGMAMEECLLVEWLKQPGDRVGDGEAVAVIETDKAEMDLESPGEGRLGEHIYEAGATVPVGNVIAYILDEGETDPGHSQQDNREATPSGAAVDTPIPAPEKGATDPAHRQPHRLSPRQRRLAAEKGADGAQSPVDPGGHSEKAAKFRRAIAAGVSEAWATIPHFSVTAELTATGLMGRLDRIREVEPRATLTDLLLSSLAVAVEESRGTQQASFGLAVATEMGVAIPVISNVRNKSIAQLVDARVQAVERAREGRYHADDATEAIGTLSNLGSRNVDHFTGVIPVGQILILTVGRVKERPVVVDNGELGVRPTFIATLNVDHRVLDGADAADIIDRFAIEVSEPHR